MKNVLLYCSILLFSFYRCQTDDVEDLQNGPEVNIKLSSLVISENGGNANVIVSLSKSSTTDIVVNLKLEGDATQDVDYSISFTSITISAGSVGEMVEINTINNSLEEGNKSILISTTDINGGFISNNTPLELIIEDDDIVQPFAMIFNEILYDPASGIDGDANGDGSRDALEDEFIELINLSATNLDISGYTVYDSKAITENSPRHTFPTGSIIPAGKALILFGGGSPTGNFGGAIVQTATGGEINLTNSGDIITIKDLNGDVALSFDITPLSANPDESYTRNPDLTGDFVQHTTVNGLFFSPGTQIDGSAF